MSTQPTLPDLDSRNHVHDLVVDFYREIIMDERLGPIFIDVAEVDWEVHIPLLIDYWCRILLDDPAYNGAILDAHRHVHSRLPLELDDFTAWYELWVICVDRAYRGPSASTAKTHAAKIASTLSRLVLHETWNAPALSESAT